MDGRIVGSNFLWEQSAIAGVGPITVDPEVQNGKIGRRLMAAVLDRGSAAGRPGIRLVQAAFHSRSLSLYAKLGFVAREPLANMQGSPLEKALPGFVVRKAERSDLDACDAVCRQVHGHDRNGELAAAIDQGTATLVEHGGRIVGYATLIGFFGHAVGETNDALKALIGAAAGFAGPGMLVPTRNAELFRWCLDNGLRVVQPLTLMSVGLYNEPKGAFLPSILF
jgi:N-acetylglutamate synthase-like GNAT family acetyltransferase